MSARSQVEREVVVHVALDEGEAPDMVKRFGSTPFAPDTLVITWRSTNSGPWRRDRVKATGPRRLKSGKLSTAPFERYDYDWSRHDELPEWAIEIVLGNVPEPVSAIDLPVGEPAVDLDAASAS